MLPTGDRTTLTLNGLAGDNTYTITARGEAPAVQKTINVNGSGLSDPDVLNLSGNGRPVTVKPGHGHPDGGRAAGWAQSTSAAWAP